MNTMYKYIKHNVIVVVLTAFVVFPLRLFAQTSETSDVTVSTTDDTTLVVTADELTTRDSLMQELMSEIQELKLQRILMQEELEKTAFRDLNKAMHSNKGLLRGCCG